MKEAFLEDTTAIRWSLLKPESVEPAIKEALAEAERNLDALANTPTEAITFKTTLQALEESTETLGRAWGRVQHLDSVCNSEELREAHNSMLPLVTDFFTRITLDEGVWKVLQHFRESEEAKDLSPVKKRFLEETVRDFRQNGAELPPDKKERLKTLQSELAEKSQKFSENVLDSTNAWDLVVDDETKLEGLPETARNTALASAREKDRGDDENPKWRFTLHAPSFAPVLEYLDDEDIREKVWRGVSLIGRVDPHDNTQLIRDILRLRQKKAELLGKENFADLVLENRMAKDGATALGFVEDLHDRIGEQFQEEIQRLETFKADKTGGTEEHLEPWETAYWAEKLRHEEYAFSEEELRPYFSLAKVIDGMFRLCEDVFDIRLTKLPPIFRDGSGKDDGATETDAVEVWHPEVEFYEIHDAAGEHLGSFYADWHPRESKRSGAWMNYLRTGLPPRASKSGRREPHIGLMCGNLTPPVDRQPSLLTHREVETVFHEFGHLLHHLLGDVEIKSLNGVNVVWDFVELPSQIMENFCWERAGLDRFAHHHETGESIPEDLFRKMLRARNFNTAMTTMRQLSFGKMDLELHIHYRDNKGQDLDALITRILAGYTFETKTPRPDNSHSFGHLFSSPTGYAAGYYSYKWAEVLDADAFTRFKEDGVISPRVGREFREKILSRGNAEEPGVLFRNFMGRDPDLTALLERSGLTKAS